MRETPHVSREAGKFEAICLRCLRGARGHLVGDPWPDTELPLPPNAERAIAVMSHCLNLTPREREVLTHCCSGLKNQAIAFRLGVSASAIRRHLRNLHRKTHTSDKSELILNLWHSCMVHDSNSLARRTAGPSSPENGSARDT